MRISLKPGTSLSPSSRHRFTSQGSMAKWSGSGTLISVVPITDTVWAGTRMSPSPGMRQRLITVWTMRWFIASIVPFPAMIWTSIPAVAAMRPAQAPAAFTIRSAKIVTCSSLTRSWHTAPGHPRLGCLQEQQPLDLVIGQTPVRPPRARIRR